MSTSISSSKTLQAYVVGLALGDGNLSNPNKRAVRLRITCDKKYQKLYKHIQSSIQELMPDNKVSIVDRINCVDVSCYSNRWESLLGWKVGSKIDQNVKIPNWILSDTDLIKICLRGIIQTDGSIYLDRGYQMVNIVSNIKSLAENIIFALEKIGYKPNVQIRNDLKTKKYTIRISKNTINFIKDIEVWKS